MDRGERSEDVGSALKARTGATRAPPSILAGPIGTLLNPERIR